MFPEFDYSAFFADMYFGDAWPLVSLMAVMVQLASLVAIMLKGHWVYTDSLKATYNFRRNPTGASLNVVVMVICTALPFMNMLTIIANIVTTTFALTYGNWYYRELHRYTRRGLSA